MKNELFPERTHNRSTPMMFFRVVQHDKSIYASILSMPLPFFVSAKFSLYHSCLLSLILLWYCYTQNLSKCQLTSQNGCRWAFLPWLCELTRSKLTLRTRGELVRCELIPLSSEPTISELAPPPRRELATYELSPLLRCELHIVSSLPKQTMSLLLQQILSCC